MPPEWPLAKPLHFRSSLLDSLFVGPLKATVFGEDWALVLHTVFAVA